MPPSILSLQKFLRIGLIPFASSVILLGLVSCEDKALVQKNEELRQRVNELEREADIAKLAAGEDPGDQSEAIKTTSEEHKKTLAKLEELDDEREKLEQELAQKEKDFRAYQRKYPVE